MTKFTPYSNRFVGLLAGILMCSFIWLFFTGFSSPQTDIALKITITKIRNQKGTVRVCAYKDAKSFDDNKPYAVKIVKKDNLKNGTLSFEMNVQKGACGIAVLDDENNNQQMDYGMMLPNEGFGFSNYFHTGMSHPEFHQFQFTISDGKTNTTSIKMKYY